MKKKGIIIHTSATLAQLAENTRFVQGVRTACCEGMSSTNAVALV